MKGEEGLKGEEGVGAVGEGQERKTGMERREGERTVGVLLLMLQPIHLGKHCTLLHQPQQCGTRLLTLPFLCALAVVSTSEDVYQDVMAERFRRDVFGGRLLVCVDEEDPEERIEGLECRAVEVAREGEGVDGGEEVSRDCVCLVAGEERDVELRKGGNEVDDGVFDVALQGRK